MTLALFRTEMFKQWRRPRTFVRVGRPDPDPADLHHRPEVESTVARSARRRGRVRLPGDQDRLVPRSCIAVLPESLSPGGGHRRLRRGRDRIRSELGEPPRDAGPPHQPFTAPHREARERGAARDRGRGARPTHRARPRWRRVRLAPARGRGHADAVQRPHPREPGPRAPSTSCGACRRSSRSASWPRR